MLENRWVRYLVYSTSAVVLSEVMYKSYLYVRDKLAQRSSAAFSEVAEVIWTNELTQTCSGRHYTASTPAGALHAVDEPMEQNGHITKLPSPTATPTCRNRFCAANNVGRIIALIDSAKYTIDLAMYTFTSYELSQAFHRALRRGVVVRVISDMEMVYSSGSQISGLDKAGIPVRYPTTTMLMHHKFCILDGLNRACSVLAKCGKTYDTKQVQGVLMSGSLNWTMQGFGGNWENILISSNKVLVQKFEDEFERMWKAFETKLSRPL